MCVGVPVIDMLKHADVGMAIVPLTITGGSRVTRDGNACEWFAGIWQALGFSSELGGERRLSAAIALLKLSGLTDLGPPTGTTDPPPLVDELARQRWTGSKTDKMLRQLVDETPTQGEREAVLSDLEQQLAED